MADGDDDGGGLLPIGMFSRASSLSIKALRAYHEGGILVPARVDRRTGYRMYTADQLGDAAVIVRLRALDLPLEQVRQVLAARDPELTRRVLGAHQVAMQERLAETERIVAELQSGVAPRTHTPVHVRSEPALHTVRITATVEEAALWPWLEAAYERLDAAITTAGGSRTGPHGALYPPEIAEEGVEHVEAFVPVAAPLDLVGRDPELGMGELPVLRVAVLVHAGGYDTIGDTYRTLGAWVARHAAHGGERVREHYLVGSGDVDEPAAYRTELCWPILPEVPAGA
jgi:DNA-binding transcriptional MerR regulator